MSNLNISHQQTIQNFGKDYVEGAKGALTQWDYDGDGSTSAVEMYKSMSTTYANVFAGNDEYSEEAQKIALARGELYAKYAGDDGVLDEYEYVEALNSDENNELLDQYWALKNAMEALEGETDIIGLTRYDSNNDGQTTIDEISQSMSALYSKVFEGDEEKTEEALSLAEFQSEILSSYDENSDGILSSEEYANALKSDEYQGTIEQYLELKNLFDSNPEPEETTDDSTASTSDSSSDLKKIAEDIIQGNDNLVNYLDGKGKSSDPVDYNALEEEVNCQILTIAEDIYSNDSKSIEDYNVTKDYYDDVENAVNTVKAKENAQNPFRTLLQSI